MLVVKTKDLKIADLACGNGVWLTDLHDELSKKNISSAVAKFDGYDINDINFPARAFLPSSVTFKKLDLFTKDLPKELLGAYDIVHIRALSSIIINNDTKPLLSVIQSMLKPGGWLQWDEGAADFIIDAPSSDKSDTITATACQAIRSIMRAGGEMRRLNREFINELDRHVGENGFENVEVQKFELRKQDYKGWTEDYLMVWEDLTAFFPPKNEQPDAPVTKEGWLELFGNAIKETERGVALYYDGVYTVVGRKAS
jgi:SAM-dependent methyltransferase